MNAEISLGEGELGEYLFIILSYNHESYIIEHLESIRFQIERWAGGRTCSIIIADDCSRDSTVRLAHAWLKSHKDLLVSYQILESLSNEGTCSNFVRVFPYVHGRRVKVLAGDDLYSSENIFELIDSASDCTLVSGLPLMLYPEGLARSRMQVFNMIASETIYTGSFLSAMQGFSTIHTPSLVYDSTAMELPGMVGFINKFAVVEDFAMQIHLARARPNLHYKVVDRYYIYYRRTHQSTYLIKQSAFVSDKTRMYRYLAELEPNPLKRLLIRNRIPCLTMRGLMKYMANANTFIYLARVVPRLLGILKRLSRIDCPIDHFREHLELITSRAYGFLAQQSEIQKGVNLKEDKFV